jgi:hypothetical protein
LLLKGGKGERVERMFYVERKRAVYKGYCTVPAVDVVLVR